MTTIDPVSTSCVRIPSARHFWEGMNEPAALRSEMAKRLAEIKHGLRT